MEEFLFVLWNWTITARQKLDTFAVNFTMYNKNIYSHPDSFKTLGKKTSNLCVFPEHQKPWIWGIG